MKIDTAGDYTLRYTATDECGNETIVDRSLVVEAPPTYRTVLYTDGTFIINESSRDQAQNEAEHGAATNVYIPFNPNGATDIDRYVFNSNGQVPWRVQAASIMSVSIGDVISPTSTAYWFHGLENVEVFDFSGLNTDNVISMRDMFSGCSKVTEIDLSGLNITNVTTMEFMFSDCTLAEEIILPNTINSVCTAFSSMFEYCKTLKTVDISMLQASSNANAYRMFYQDNLLTTIFATQNFTPQYGQFMFVGCSSLVGGAGTQFEANKNDQTYARIDNPPNEPGYFTLKTGA